MVESKSRLRKTALGIFLCATVLFLPAAFASAGPGIEIVGSMDMVSSTPGLRMLVDTQLNVGATIGSAGGTIILYDLESLSWIPVPQSKAAVPTSLSGVTADKAVVDEANHRIFFTPGNITDVGFSGCASGPHPRFAIGVFSLVTHEWDNVPVECTPHPGISGGRSADQFKVQGVFYHSPSDRLYVAGTPQGEWFAHDRGNVYTRDRLGIGMLLRQMDPNTGEVDWEVDLRGTGCDRMAIDVTGQSVGAFVARSSDFVHSYCFGLRTGLQGDQGFAIKIPLQPDGTLTTAGGRPVVRLTPTLPNDLFPMLDPVSGYILLLTSGRPNGDAVWVYDPEAERFVGVIASGISAADVANARTAAGLNIATGRTYMLSAAGLLVADARHKPMPSGLNYNLGIMSARSGPNIAVAPKLNRLFLPDGFRYIVIEDKIPQPPKAPEADPDGGTSNIPEIEGKTISSFAGASAGFGARILNTGGITRAINNVDLVCYNQGAGPIVKDTYGRCPADQVLTGGTRDLFLGPTEVQLGSQTGAVANASGAAFSSADTASDRDLKRISACFADIHRDRGLTLPGYDTACEFIPFIGDFENGTRGIDGRGSPIPGSSCGDFGDGAERDAQPSTPAYASLIGSSNVECDLQTRSVKAAGSASAFAFPSTGSPTISIGRAWSTSSSTITPQGTVTIVESVATGVKIGEYSIGRLTTVAVTKAHGLPGTNGIVFQRMISDVHGPNIDCYLCNFDQVIAAMNQGLGLKMRVSQPAAEIMQSPLGYQSLIAKDHGARESDRATNNDDLFAVSALQIVFYNDGHDGRNRLVLQLAGAQSQSQYGRVALPDVGEATFELPSIETVIEQPAVASTELSTPLTPEPAAPPRVLGAPNEFVDDAVRLIVHNPKEFALLFLLWSLLAAPLYLGLRRRSLLREVRP